MVKFISELYGFVSKMKKNKEMKITKFGRRIPCSPWAKQQKKNSTVLRKSWQHQATHQKKWKRINFHSFSTPHSLVPWHFCSLILCMWQNQISQFFYVYIYLRACKRCAHKTFCCGSFDINCVSAQAPFLFW